MQATFTVRSGRDRVKITQLAAEPSGRPHESMSRKDSPPFGEGLAGDHSPMSWGTSMPCTEFFLGSLLRKIWGLRPTAWLSGLHCPVGGTEIPFAQLG